MEIEMLARLPVPVQEVVAVVQEAVHRLVVENTAEHAPLVDGLAAWALVWL